MTACRVVHGTRGADGAGISAPQVPAENQHRAEEQRRRVGADRAGLHAAQAALLPARTSAPTPLTVPSISPASTPFHSAPVDSSLIGWTIGGVVELVDVVLVEQQPVDAAELPRQRRRPPRGCRSQKYSAMPMPASATPVETPISISSVDVAAPPRPRARSAPAARPCAGLHRLARRRRGRRGLAHGAARCDLEARLEERLDPVAAAERVRHADVAGERPSRSPARSAESPSTAAPRAARRGAPWP